ncbi:MAG TPA: hypothetical protein VJ740_08235 [Hyphomicrobiaceae bacterium]|jgi:hypothetical protein|nr:hypothetical protein [Hyphomicrobiaceae bacterium]
MNFVRLKGGEQAIEAMVEEVESGTSWSKTNGSGEIARFGARLSQLLAQETPNDLLARVAEFRRSVEQELRRTSSIFQILEQLEESGLQDCARCTEELEGRLATNPHYIVLRKLAEAEKQVAEITASHL